MRLPAIGYKHLRERLTLNAEATATDPRAFRRRPDEPGRGLTGRARALFSPVMLQRNTTPRQAHLAHAAVVGVHAVCCGLPALAMLAAALSGAASGLALFSDSLQVFHRFLHGYELWILTLSTALVTAGGALELSARWGRRRHGFPWLFAFSLACFVINIAVVLSHRL